MIDRDGKYISSEEEFIRYRKSFKVAPYALADVIEALSNDQDNNVDIVVTKEDDSLVVMFYRRHISTDTNSDSKECPAV